jgi:hypothetical protein
MSRISSIIALVAISTLGTAVLSSTEASAWPIKKPCCLPIPKPLPKPLPKPKPIVFPHHHHWRPIYAAPIVAPLVATKVVAARSCLTKEYTPQGAVLFKDLCTGEAAMNPPAIPALTSDSQ